MLFRFGVVLVAFVAAILFLSWCPGAPLGVGCVQVLDAIRKVESGGESDPPDGDGGRSIGPYQISLAYYRDACQQDNTLLKGSYRDCRRREYAERVVEAYMKRWCPAAWAAMDAEVIARTHNGGPQGPKRSATLPYWRKVRAELVRSLPAVPA